MTANSEYADTTKIPYLEWLWLQHETHTNHFYPLAHLVLDGGPPPTCPWKNKTSLNPLFVKIDVETLYATRRPGVLAHHVALSKEAIIAYAQSTDTIATLIEARRPPPSNHTTSVIKQAQTQPFHDAGIRLIADTLHPACTFTDTATGYNCPARALPASTLCARHGGETYSPTEIKALYRAAREKILAATEAAVDVTVDLMLHSPNDEVRRKSAESIMDRTGIIPGAALHVTAPAPTDQSPTDILRDRLSRLTDPTPELTPSPPSDTFDLNNEQEIFEGEIVNAPAAATESDVPRP